VSLCVALKHSATLGTFKATKQLSFKAQRTKLRNNWILAAIADGVGSAENSAIGSEIAVKTALKLCEDCFPWSSSVNDRAQSIQELIAISFVNAENQIEARANQDQKGLAAQAQEDASVRLFPLSEIVNG